VSERIEQLKTWMQAGENEHFEFKEARTSFEFEKLVGYCVALANEGGGRIFLGITDKKPRRVVGTLAFRTLGRTKNGLMNAIHLRIDAEQIDHTDGRVLVFKVPSRPIGLPIQYKGQYFMRSGDSLVPMLPDVLKRILDEAEPDYSAEVCDKATLDDLDLNAIDIFRARWAKKSGNERLKGMAVEQLLSDAELVTNDGVTNAALVLLGKSDALSRCLSQAEVIFEYRSSDATGPAQQRHEFRLGFFSFYDELWKLINLRNDMQHSQDGLFILDIPTFNEEAVREAILNAISHRDYRLGSSVFVRQYPLRLEIVSPGGFPPGISLANILWEQAPRNRRIAEAFGRCGLVERSGQGMNRIFETCIKESKPRPDFTNTDSDHVWLTLHGNVTNQEFLRFFEKLGRERLETFSTSDFLLVDLVSRGQKIPDRLKDSLFRLVEIGVIEKTGRGRGSQYVLSRKFYKHLGKAGTYTRRKGLDRDTNKALLLKHIEGSPDTGSRMEEFYQVLPSHNRGQIQSLLRELRDEGKIHVQGKTRGAKWYPGQIPLGLQ